LSDILKSWAPRARGTNLTKSYDVSNEHHESAVLVGIELGSEHGIGTDESLDELKALTESAGAEVAGIIRQRLKAPDPRTFIGKGKTAQVRELAQAKGASLAIFDDALTPAQDKK